MRSWSSPDPSGITATGGDLAIVARHVGQKPADRRHGLGIGIDEGVDQPGLVGMQPPAAQLLEIDLLADGHRHQPRARYRHDRALLHHGEIGAAALPGRRAERGIERRGHPRRIAHTAKLGDVVAKQETHALGAHGVGQACAGRFADMNERQPALGAHPPHIAHLSRVRCAGRGAFGGEVVDHHADVAAVDLAETGDLAVTWRALDVGIIHARSAENAELDEALPVDQCLEPLCGVELTARAALGELVRPAHGAAGGSAPLELRKRRLMRHGGPPSRVPARRRIWPSRW